MPRAQRPKLMNHSPTHQPAARVRTTAVLLALSAGMPSALAAGGAEGRSRAPAVAEVLVLSGEPAPDGNGEFSRFYAPVLNDAGQVAFHAQLQGTTGGSRDNKGIFRSGEGGEGSRFVQIVRAGAPVAASDGSFSGFSTTPALNEVGQVEFHATIADSQGGANKGIFRGDGAGPPVAIAIKTFPAPGGQGRYADFPGVTSPFNDRDQAAFYAQIQSDSRGAAGIYRGDSMSNVETIARTGDPLPEGGGAFASFSNTPPSINAGGQVAFISGSAIYLSDGETLAPIVSSGDRAPGSRGNFGGLQAPVLNDEGQMAFITTLTVRGFGPVKSMDAIYRADGEAGPVKIAMEGDAAPGGAGTFDSFEPPAINDQGRVAFRATIAGAAKGYQLLHGIFLADGEGELVQVAREGQALPDGAGSIVTLQMPAFNDAGDAAFAAKVTDANGRPGVAIFFFNDSLGLVSVASKGEPLLGSTITTLDFTIPTNGAPLYGSGLNDAGRVAYAFALADGRRGIAVWGAPDAVGE